MQWLVFGFMATLVALGVRKMMRETREGLRKESKTTRTTPFPSAEKKFSEAPQVAQDTAPCPVCQAYVVSGVTHCGREGCPYPREQDAQP
jgi:hypothetical protein